MMKTINRKKRARLKIIHINLKKARILLQKKNVEKIRQMRKLREEESSLDSDFILNHPVIKLREMLSRR